MGLVCGKCGVFGKVHRAPLTEKDCALKNKSGNIGIYTSPIYAVESYKFDDVWLFASWSLANHQR